MKMIIINLTLALEGKGNTTRVGNGREVTGEEKIDTIDGIGLGFNSGDCCLDGGLGWWAPLGYIVFYVVGTILLLPSTPLNVSGGLIFKVAGGLFCTSCAAIVAAMGSFFYAG